MSNLQLFQSYGQMNNLGLNNDCALLVIIIFSINYSTIEGRMGYLFLSIFGLLFIMGHPCDPIQTTLPSSSCLIMYQVCQTFLMISCTRKTCVQYSSDRGAHCLREIQTSFSGTDCMHFCCGEQNQPITLDGLSLCIARNQQAEARLNAIILSLSIGCPIICAIFVAIWVILRQQKLSQQGNKTGHLTSAKTEAMGSSEIIWENSKTNMADPDDNVCSICTDHDTDLLTQCGHRMHFQCLVRWIPKRPVCPNCISENFNPVKLCCIKCKTRFRTIKMDVNSKFKSLIKTDKDQYCSQCNAFKSN